MQVRELVQKTTQFFKEKGFASARLDAELLIAAGLKWERLQLYTKFDYPLLESDLLPCRDLVKRRAKGEPVAYILGEKEFYSNKFLLEQGVLIPRPETEMLVDWALNSAPEAQNFVDLGCGSGCVGLSVLFAQIKKNPKCRLIAIDSSEAACRITQINADKMALSDRVKIIHSSVEEINASHLTSFFFGETDLILANPPYIDFKDPLVEANVRQYEPSEALFSAQEGLAHIQSWANWSSAILANNKKVAFEIGSQQGAAAQNIFRDCKGSYGNCLFSQIELHKDLANLDRMITAEKRGV